MSILTFPATFGNHNKLGSTHDPFGSWDDLITVLKETPDPSIPDWLWQQALAGPLAEFLSRPGKRFRSRLVEISWRLAGGSHSPPPELGLAIELFHAGSLILDDIEDGSLQRRGQPALHRLIGLPLALNAGNWLYFVPGNLIARLDLPPEIELDLHRRTTDAVRRCHEGQALDLTARTWELSQDELPDVVLRMSEWKTGTLLGLAAAYGAVAAGADEKCVEAVQRFGIRLGVGLQMQNDLSELTGQAGPIKHTEDLLQGRATWPWAWAAQRLEAGPFAALQARSRLLAAGKGDAAVLVRELLAALRPAPRQAVRSWLRAAFAELAIVVNEPRALAELKAEVTRLEERYV